MIHLGEIGLKLDQCGVAAIPANIHRFNQFAH
jgi:hypothetical protein